MTEPRAPYWPFITGPKEEEDVAAREGSEPTGADGLAKQRSNRAMEFPSETPEEESEEGGEEVVMAFTTRTALLRWQGPSLTTGGSHSLVVGSWVLMGMI